ncbi:malate/lactate/ureidoglycolate dehydrogenase [Paracandidimonas soli]|uniref:Putative oxidoreductase n=1 Tax=Paracandidimonas soli TaxID=1917182 RepID=A0A4R3V539_9BURK|nr:malate/lactate/ureidoglycolate dehydrogenase [Paracandidimonas soli]TCU98428.1 putative oxidoreductase [Paracandidimonas soli]
MKNHHLFEAALLRSAVHEVIRGFGCDEEQCALIADNLVRANLTGHDSHGVGMLPRYARAYREGSLQPKASLQQTKDAGILLTLDGQMGFGQSIGRQAMDLAISRTREHGACIMALGNTHHLGRIGEWAEMAVEHGLVSIHFVNVISRPIVAPWGGSDARYGTNPFAIGIPLRSGDRFILDFATSIIAQGKTRVAYNRGASLKPGQMLDDRGQPTTDPVYGVLNPLGALLPFGEHKGFGLAMACELLGGALAGGWSVNGPADGKQRVVNGMLSILFDPSKIAQPENFEEYAQRTIAWIKASPPQPEIDRIVLAGETERDICRERTHNGIPVDTQTWQDILQSASELGVDSQRINRCAGM